MGKDWGHRKPARRIHAATRNYPDETFMITVLLASK
jgi:hypothetical protein